VLSRSQENDIYVCSYLYKELYDLPGYIGKPHYFFVFLGWKRDFFLLFLFFSECTLRHFVVDVIMAVPANFDLACVPVDAFGELYNANAELEFILNTARETDRIISS